MEKNKNDSKTKLEKSKTRLANAFNRLELVIEKLANSPNKEATKELDDLREKVSTMSAENDRLVIKLTELSTNYHDVENTNKEVIDELDNSINSIQNILNSHYADSRHSNQE